MAVSFLQHDFILRASHVEHELKSVLINTPACLVHMKTDETALEFSIIFQSHETLLRRIFCDCLFAYGLLYTEENQEIILKESGHSLAFLNALRSAVKDFKNQVAVITHSETTFNTPSVFFSNHPHKASDQKNQAGFIPSVGQGS